MAEKLGSVCGGKKKRGAKKLLGVIYPHHNNTTH